MPRKGNHAREHAARSCPEVNKQVKETSAPTHSPVILLTENKILNMKGICFEFI